MEDTSSIWDYGCNDTVNCTDYIFDPDEVSVIGLRHWFALVCYGLVFLLGVPGNALVAWVTAFRMPHSVNALWFLNLALADLLCCLSLPLLMVPLAGDQHWPFGPLACKLLHGLLFLVMYCSVLLLVLISLDRWLLVSRPVWCQNWRQPRWAHRACAGVWLLALLGTVPQFIYMEEIRPPGVEKLKCLANYNSVYTAWASTIMHFLLGLLLPFLAICACHWTVYWRTRDGPGVGGRGRERSARTLRIILAVVLSFFLCWLPLHIVEVALLVIYHDVEKHSLRANLRLAQVLTLCLAYFNSCLNPLLYVCLGRGFKESMTRSLRSVLHLGSEEPQRGHSLANTKSTLDNTLEKSV